MNTGIKENEPEEINDGVEVSPINYLGISAFIIGFLVEKGHLKVRKDKNGIHFMKSDMDEYLNQVRARSAELATERAAAA